MPLEDAVAWNVGRYTVHGEIASGGMATVHIGRLGGTAGFSKLVAIKRMHPQFAKDPDFLAMFVDEARLVTRIRHPNVVQPLDIVAEGGEVLLVMEYIHGEALSRINRVLRPKNERIPIRIAAAIMSGALHGLHAAHEAKSEKGEPLDIVHRDISPQNIIVGVDGISRVLDFGIAKAADQVHLTREGELKGKLVYMAPEQLLGERVTRRTDIFSATVVLWECLTGQRLFESESQSPLLARAKHQKIEPPSELSPEVPPALDAVVLKGLALDQDDRWATAREMAMALEEALPPATTAQVGVWVEQVAAKALASRQARIHEIESAGAESTARTREMVADIASDRIYTRDIVSSNTARRTPPPAPHSARTGSQRAVAPPPPPPPDAPPTRIGPHASQPDAPRFSSPDGSGGFRAGPPSGGFDARFGPPSGSGPHAGAIGPQTGSGPYPAPRLSRPDGSGPAPSLRDPYYVPPGNPLAMPQGPVSLEPPPIPTEHAKPAKTTVQKIGRRSRLGTVLLLLLMIGVIAAVVGGPVLIKHDYQDRLRAAGIESTIDEVDLFSQLGTARLVGVTLTSPGVPGVSVHANEVLVELNRRLEPTSIVAREVDATVEVGYAPLLSTYGDWSNKHSEGRFLGLPASVRHFRVETGKLTWNQPSGAGTKVLASGIIFDTIAADGRPLGEDWALKPTSLDLTTPAGAAGPWLMDGKHETGVTTVSVSFNQAHQQSFGLDVRTANGQTDIDLRAARATLEDLGLKPVEIGGDPTDQVKVDAAAHVTLKADTVQGNANLTVDGMRAPKGPPGQLVLKGSFGGPRGRSLEIKSGRIALGAQEASLGGTVMVYPDGFSLKLAALVPARCDAGVVSMSVATALDSRDLGAATLELSPRGCTPGKHK